MAKVKAIPDGYHSVTPFLFVKGAQKALDFYKAAFGALEIEKHAAPDGRIMHAVIRIGNSLVMLADEFPESGCGVVAPTTLKGSSAMFHIYVEDVDRMFDQAVKAGAQVNMPLQDTFWGDRYGQLADPFGHMWSMAAHIADYTPEEMEQKTAEFMKNKESGK